MGKKYLDTKKGTLESSILGVWQNAIEESDARMDGRTKEYREHRKKLESARSRREEKKVSVKKEQPETIHGAGEHAFEIGTDRYAEYTQKITPGQIEEAFILLDEQQFVYGEGSFTEEQIEIIESLQEMTEEEHDELLDQMDDDQLEMYEGILKKIGGFIKKKAVRFGTKQGRATAKLDKAKKKQTLAKTKQDIVTTKADTKATKKATKAAAADAGIGVVGKAKKLGKAAKKKAGDVGRAIKKSATEDEYNPLGETAVNPKDREELDVDAKNSAKKMKKAQEPAPNQMAEAQSGDKEAYKKFFDAALKKFKVSSPADFKSDEEKKKFYDYIDKNWEGDNEKAEGAMSQVREFKIQSMKAALAQVWGMEEGKNPFAEHKGTKPHKHPHEEDTDEENEKRTKTETGKKPATIDLKPKLDDK